MQVNLPELQTLLYQLVTTPFRSLVAELADRCTLGSAKSREVCARRRPFSNAMDQSENLPETRERCGRCGGTGWVPPRRKRRGHPSWLETEQDWPKVLEHAEALASRFLNQTQIALGLGISLTTLMKYKREFTQFTHALKRGRAKMLAALAVKASEMALDGNNPALTIFLAKVHLGWRETLDLNVSSNLGIGPTIEAMDDERKRQMRVIRCLTPEERRQWLDLMRRAEARMKGEEPMPLREIEAETVEPGGWHRGRRTNPDQAPP